MPQWKPKIDGNGNQEKSENDDQAKVKGTKGKGKEAHHQGNWKGKDGYQAHWQGKDGHQGKGKGKNAYQAKGSSKDAYYQGKGYGKDASWGWEPKDAYNQGKGYGKDASWGWEPKDLAETYKTQLQTHACQILSSKPDGICGGHLSQLLTEADGASVVAAFGTTGADGQNGPNGQKLQRGWLHTLMRGLPNVSCERHGGGRDNMYTLKPGVMQLPLMNGAAAPFNAQWAAAVPATSMRPADFLGDWRDSLGNSVSVLKDTKDAQFKVVLKQPPRKDVTLYMFLTSLGGGYTSWCCGNSYMQLESSTSMQLCWFTADGRMSIWMRAPATHAVNTSGAQIEKAPSTIVSEAAEGPSEKAPPEPATTADVEEDEAPSCSKE